MRLRTTTAALAVVLAACGGSDLTELASTTTAGSESTPAQDEQTPDDATSTTEVTAPLTFEDRLLVADLTGDPPEATTAIGGADFAAARAITDELVAAGVDLTGMEIWVFDVAGTADRLLVVEAGAAAESLTEDSAAEEFIQALIGTEALAASGATRFVMNYRDTDDEGAFALTVTTPLDAMIEAVSTGGSVDSELVDIQFVRTGTSGAPAATTTTAATTTSTTTTVATSEVLLADTFNGSTTATPLFGEDVVTAQIVDDLALQVTTVVGGVIPVMYPEPLPDRVSITWAIAPIPADPETSFGAVVLADDPSDGGLDHYVAVLANPTSGELTIWPFDAAAGGWGTATTVAIPPEAVFTAEEWSTMSIDLVDGTVAVAINEFAVTTWSGATPTVTGHWGPTILSSGGGDDMLVSLVLVEVLP